MNQSILINTALIAIILFVLIQGLVYGKSFFIILAFSALIAFLVNPIARYLEQRGFSRAASSIISVIMIILSVLLFFAFASVQIAIHGSEIFHIEENVLLKIQAFENLIRQKLHGYHFIIPHFGWLFKAVAYQVKDIVSLIPTVLITLVLIILYVFFLLYYRSKLQHFMLMRASKDNKEAIQETIERIGITISDYLSGVLLVIVMLIVFYSLSLSLLGINAPILWSVIAGILHIIPYIGIVVGAFFPLVIALAVKGSIASAVGVCIVFAFAVIIESNILTPYIMGSKIHVNPLALITAVMLGNTIWGIAGLILAVPLMGILKVIFDHVESFAPYSYLISNHGSNHKTR